MEQPELTVEQQRDILNRTSPWIPLEGDPLGQGGGARVFKVVSRATVFRLQQLLFAFKFASDNAAYEKPTQGLLQFWSDLSASDEIDVAAAKVAKRPDDRVKREIEVLRDVQHPNLIKMIGYDKQEKPSWYVMPVMKGGTLKERKDLAGNTRVVVGGMLQLARALSALHKHTSPITHRDIKPGNVFLSETGDWILGDPGIAYRDDEGEETRSTPVSRDWAPKWYDDKFSRSPRADLYMLASTALSVLAGGSKALAPTFLDKPEFVLPKRFPEAPGITELYALIRGLIVAEPEGIQYDDATGLVPVLEGLLPIVENNERTQLREEVTRLRREPELLISFVNSSTNLYSGNHPGLERVLVRIPQDCVRLLCWQRGDNGHRCTFRLLDAGHHQVQQEVSLLDDNLTSIEVPAQMRGDFARITITGQSGMLHSLMVYVERS